jgi:hypothetical protein
MLIGILRHATPWNTARARRVPNHAYRRAGFHRRFPSRRTVPDAIRTTKKFLIIPRVSKTLRNRAPDFVFCEDWQICSATNDRHGACVRLLASWGSWMRTLSAILLTAVMGLPMAMPLFASGETALPVCCRRDGKHHCMGKTSTQIDVGAVPAVSGAQTNCPQFPKVLGVTSHSQLGLSTSTAVFAGIISHPALSPQTQSNYRVSLLRSHQKRGPPPSSALC